MSEWQQLTVYIKADGPPDLTGDATKRLCAAIGEVLYPAGTTVRFDGLTIEGSA